VLIIVLREAFGAGVGMGWRKGNPASERRFVAMRIFNDWLEHMLSIKLLRQIPPFISYALNSHTGLYSNFRTGPL
jgi:hypothetical protein